jgi:hypothetical protein
MAYTPQTWIDTVTDDDAAHHNYMEAGIQAAAATADAAIPKATIVAARDLIVGTGPGAAGRLAAGTNGQWLRAKTGGLVWEDAMGYGTTFPTTPVNGDQFVLVDSVSSPTYQWQFRFNASRSVDAFKWEFIGGSEILVDSGGSVFTQSAVGTFQAFGPSITAPRGGIVKVRVQAFSQNGSGSTCQFVIYTGVNGNPSGVAGSAIVPSGGGATIGSFSNRGVVQGDAIAALLDTSVAGAQHTNILVAVSPVAMI